MELHTDGVKLRFSGAVRVCHAWNSTVVWYCKCFKQQCKGFVVATVHSSAACFEWG